MRITLPQSRSCFVCGTENPLGLKLEFSAESGRVRTLFKPRREHAGFQNTVHGGLTSTVLDEAMVWACGAATGRFTFCAELTVRFVKPVRPGTAYEVIGILKENRRNRLLLAESELRDPSGALLAAASGKYMPIAEDSVGTMLADFSDDPREAFALLAGEKAPDISEASPQTRAACERLVTVGCQPRSPAPDASLSGAAARRKNLTH